MFPNSKLGADNKLTVHEVLVSLDNVSADEKVPLASSCPVLKLNVHERLSLLDSESPNNDVFILEELGSLIAHGALHKYDFIILVLVY